MPLSPFWIWLIVAIILFVMELLLPTAFVEATLGLSALIVAFLSFLIPSFSIQILLWMVLSVVVVFLLRRYQPKRVPPVLKEAAEAETITKIPAGETGRVLYEGISWQARCDDPRLTIPEHQRVIIIGRQGTTLIVMPEDAIQSYQS
ncbi:MAG: NfeD family protein [Thermosynechococcus sp.]